MAAATRTITLNGIEEALLRWEERARRGEPRSAEETAKLPAEQVAKESALTLWGLLDHEALAG